MATYQETLSSYDTEERQLYQEKPYLNEVRYKELNSVDRAEYDFKMDNVWKETISRIRSQFDIVYLLCLKPLEELPTSDNSRSFRVLAYICSTKEKAKNTRPSENFGYRKLYKIPLSLLGDTYLDKVDRNSYRMVYFDLPKMIKAAE